LRNHALVACLDLIIDDDETLMSESAKRGREAPGGGPGEGPKAPAATGARSTCGPACSAGRMWRPRRRRTCPVCHVDRSICLTCDQVVVVGVNYFAGLPPSRQRACRYAFVNAIRPCCTVT